MHIRRLTPSDASAYQSLRLAALQDTPSAFGSSHEEERDRPVSEIEARLAVASDSGVFGAFEVDTLVGLVGLRRESMKNLAHKVRIWGMYVVPAARGKGVGRALLLEALALARSTPEITRVNLSANAGNVAAVHLYESAGFQIFGREPDAMCIDGELHDEVLMCLRFVDR
jgi:RimJ/RimL family protein N-acetyltransferase